MVARPSAELQPRPSAIEEEGHVNWWMVAFPPIARAGSAAAQVRPTARSTSVHRGALRHGAEPAMLDADAPSIDDIRAAEEALVQHVRDEAAIERKGIEHEA